MKIGDVLRYTWHIANDGSVSYMIGIIYEMSYRHALVRWSTQNPYHAAIRPHQGDTSVQIIRPRTYKDLWELLN